MIIINCIEKLKEYKSFFAKLKGTNYQQTYENIKAIHLSNDSAITIIDDYCITTFTKKNDYIMECALNIEPIIMHKYDKEKMLLFLNKVSKELNKTLYFPLVYEDSNFYKLLKNDLYNYQRLYTSIIDYGKIDNDILTYINKSDRVYFSKRSVNKFENKLYIKYYTKKSVKRIIKHIELNSWKHIEQQDMISKNSQLIYYNELVNSGIANIAVAYDKHTNKAVSYRIDGIGNNKIHVLKNSYIEEYKKYSPGSYMLLYDLYKTYKNYSYVDLYGGPGQAKQMIETNKIDRYDMFYGDLSIIKEIETNRKVWDKKNYDNYLKGNSIKEVFNKKENILVATSCFGLGPVGKLNTIIEHVKDKYNWYASGEKFDMKIFGSNIFKDTCFTLDKEIVKRFVGKHHIKYAIVVLKNKMARLLTDIGIKVIYVDSLPFMWSIKDAEEGKVPYNVEVYCAQKTLPLNDTSKKIFSNVKNLVWVNSIIDNSISDVKKNKMHRFTLINIGGLHSPNTDGIDYINVIVKPLVELIRSKRIIITTSTKSKELITNLFKDYSNVKVKTLTQKDFVKYIIECDMFLTSPGLTTILESSRVRNEVIFLPPQNISQFYNVEYGKKIFPKYKEITWNNPDLTLQGLKDKLNGNEKEVIEEINRRINHYNESQILNNYKLYISSVLNNDYYYNSNYLKLKYNGAEMIAKELEKIVKE